jgi:GT2 family glycosyltransferase
LASPEPLVSVVVPVRDQADELRTLLDALARQTIPPERYEIVIGDDGSRDNSIQRLASEDGRVRILSGPPQNQAAARNRAAAAAAAPVLAFTDADCKPDPTWLEAGLRALQRADVAGGAIRSSVPVRPSVWTLMYMERLSQERNVKQGYAITPNLFVRRHVFSQVGGFDESLRHGEDADFVERCTATGARLVYAPDASVEHPARESGKLFMSRVWSYERWNATRRRRGGQPPTVRQVFGSLPLFGQIWRRRSLGLPATLDRRRLAAYGIKPRLRDDLKALVLLYLLLPFVRFAAGGYGWIVGGRRRTKPTT